LAVYDSNSGEIVEDSNLSSFNVNAELQMVDIKEEPKNGASYSYGNFISFKFSLKDTISGKAVFALNPAFANVFLVLRHQQGKGRSYISANQSASHFPEKGQPQGFQIKWEINPNAISGEGTVSVIAEGTDGNVITIHREPKKEASYNVNVGGNIEVKHRAQSTPIDTTETAFIAYFNLECQNKQLHGAQLVAFVQFQDGEVAQQLPVATNENGGYEVSWTVPHNQAPAGSYELRLYRQIDRQRLGQDAIPLSKVPIVHNPAPSQSPISTAFFVAAALAGAVYYSFQKTFKGK